MISAPAGVALLLAILVVRPFVEVRVFVIPLRMTIVNEAVQVRTLRANSRKRLVVLAYGEDPRYVNAVVAHHLGRYAGWWRGPRSLLLVMMFIAQKLGCRQHVQVPILSAPYDDIFWHRTYNYRPMFSHTERLTAVLGLHTLGITESTRAIAILTRDRAFFKNFTDREEWLRAHDFRNCRIENYSKAIEYADSRGYRSVRVGRISDNHLAIEPRGYVDYSSSESRSDLMDLVLATRCEFIVTCSSGLDSLYWLCGKPFVGVNLPWLDGKFSNFLLCLPKHMLVESEGQLTELPLIAVTSPSFAQSTISDRRVGPEWNGKPIVFAENSAAEILETLELALRMLADPELIQERRALVAPLWKEFNSRVAASNLGPYSRQRTPTMPMPDSVMARFLEVRGGASR